MLKAIATFIVGFVGVILFLNAITWLFGQAVASIVAWVVTAGALVAIVIGMTLGGWEAKELSEPQASALRDYMRSVS